MDFVTKAYAYNGTVRIYVATSTNLVGEAIKRSASALSVAGNTFQESVSM